jgi:hypothetical protein
VKEELPKKKSSLPLRQAKRSRQSLDGQVLERNFAFGELWKGKVYATKQVEVYAAKEDDDWLAITFVTRFF